MKLNKNYILNILNLSNLLNENRIEKLRLQKFPEDIIKAVIEFSKLTSRNPEDENLVQQNQYIPWFAAELKKDEDIAKDEKLKVVINWIKKSNFPKFPSNMPFDKVYETAINWFLNKNIDPITLKEMSGGDTVIDYPDGSKWIRVKDKNFCMRVGETRGWCFSEIGRAGEFIKSKGGYMLIDKDGSAKMAVQFDKKSKAIIDWQGAFNKVPNKNSAMKSADLISKLGEILQIDLGHANTIGQALNEYPDFKKWISSLNNIKLAPLNRFLLGFELTPEQMQSIPVEQKLKHKIPLTDEEIKNLPPDLKLKHKIPLTDEEIKNLSPLAKLANGYKIKSSEVKLLPILMQKIISVMKGADPQEVFTEADFGDSKLYRNYEADSKKMELNVANEYWDYSGLSDDDMGVFSNADNYYAMDDARNSEEHKYMGYKLLGKENEALLKELSEILHKPIDSEDDNGIWDFIDKNLLNSEEIKDTYLTEVYEYKSEKFREIRDKIIAKEQKFKLDYQTDILTLPWKKLLKFIAEKNFYLKDDITTFKDLKDAEINKVQGGYGLYDVWSNIWPKPKDVSYMQQEIKRLLEKDLETFTENPEFIKNSDDAEYLLKKLGFIDKNGRKRSVNMPNDGGIIEVDEVDIENRKFKVRIFTSGEAYKSGFIDFDSLASYVTMPKLFENKIRKIVRKMLAEDFRFMYDKQNYTPPTDVVYTAQKAINAVNSNKLVQSNASNEGSGLQKAQTLVSKEPITHAQLKRMKAFFDKNFQDVSQERSAGKNINNSEIIQKWELWGGDAGRKWVEKQIGATQSNNKTSKKVRNSDMIARDNRIMDPHNTRIHR